jgi:hypothetical protein
MIAWYRVMPTHNSLLLVTVLAVLGGPALAKHKDATVNVFSPPPNQIGQIPVFVRNGKPIIAPMNAQGAEEPNWDNAKTLPDVTADQTKAINKLQDSSRKNVAMIRNELATAEQKLKDLKAHKPVQPDPETANSALAFLNPDGTRYMGPLLADPSMMDADQQDESVDDVQARVDSLKQEVLDINKSSANQLRTLLSEHQIEELNLMRQGKFILQQPDIIASSGFAGKPVNATNNKMAMSPSNAGSGDDKAGKKVLKNVLRTTERALLWHAIQRI